MIEEFLSTKRCECGVEIAPTGGALVGFERASVAAAVNLDHGDDA